MADQARIIKLLILIFAVVGLIAVLGFGVWGIAKIAKTLPSPAGAVSRLASLISGITLTKELVESASNVTADPKTIISGETFTLEWRAPNKGTAGIYELEYDCHAELTLALPTGEEILCNAPFNLWSKETMGLTAISKSEAPAELSISINFIAQGTNVPAKVGSANIIVSPKEDTPKAAGAPPKAAALTAGKEKISARLVDGIVPSVGGAANLAIQIADVGIINETTGVFTHATSVSANQRAGIVFDIMNIGGVPSSQWRFRAALPAAGGDYLSDAQDPIAAGTKVRYTIGFKDLTKTGENAAAITIDPSQQISDADRANNTATTTIVRNY